MADLVLQDFRDLSIENLVQVLSNEKNENVWSTEVSRK